MPPRDATAATRAKLSKKKGLVGKTFRSSEPDADCSPQRSALDKQVKALRDLRDAEKKATKKMEEATKAEGEFIGDLVENAIDKAILGLQPVRAVRDSLKASEKFLERYRKAQKNLQKTRSDVKKQAKKVAKAGEALQKCNGS